MSKCNARSENKGLLSINGINISIIWFKPVIVYTNSFFEPSLILPIPLNFACIPSNKGLESWSPVILKPVFGRSRNHFC